LSSHPVVKRRSRQPEAFERRFENAAVLDELLEIAGSTLRTVEVVKRFRNAQVERKPSSEVIPTLLPPEPRFSHPDIARRLFQNLLGLWDAAADPRFQLDPETGRGVRHFVSARPRPPRVRRPGPAGPGSLDAAYCQSVRAWLANDAGGRERLNHSFENRQDALLALLDERGLSDQGWGVLRHLGFELHALLELSVGAAPAAVQPEALRGQTSTDVPAVLVGFVDEAVALAEQDQAGPVPEAERGTVRALGRQMLEALWRARARR
jgi:hypothetical protein